MQKLSLCKGMVGDGDWAGLVYPVTDGMGRLLKKAGRRFVPGILHAGLCVPAIGNGPSLSSPTTWEGLSTGLGAQGTLIKCRLHCCHHFSSATHGHHLV